MGNDFCNCSFLDDEQNEEKNISYIQKQQLSIIPNRNQLKNKFNKNNKHVFYLKSSKVEIPYNGQLNDNPSIRINQLYIINRLKFLSKKIREFLIKKRVHMTTGEILTQKNDNNLLNTLFSFNRNNYLNTDTGEVANKNLSQIKEQNYQEKQIKKTFSPEQGYNENDGIVYIKLSDNSELEGIYYNNALNGFARVFFSNKDTYRGEIYNDCANGYGIYYFARHGCAYEGTWENNYKSGIGLEEWWYEAYYKGEFRNGKKNGLGTYMWKDGSFYEGEWLNNNIHGYGIFRNKDKKIYKGQFIMNSMNGYGEMTYLNNDSFFYGFWKENNKNGFGVEYSPRKDGRDKIYSGFWENNERHGYGALLNKKEDENNKNILAVWKKNKICKQFYTLDEFCQSIKQSGFENFLFFFERTFDEHISIIRNINNHGD